jgi:hypothetical protein
MAQKNEETEHFPSPPTGVFNDAKVIQYFYALQGIDIQTVSTTTFLLQSATAYNAAWLAREIVQNWVDHNHYAPGTLDGVRLKMQYLPNKVRRFTIEGDWPFTDNTGLYAPHSDKPKGRHNAGGNGIGLKQTAILFLRDFSVSRFEIIGEGWTINYRIAKAAEINQQLQACPDTDIPYTVKNDWLIAEIRETESTGTCAYIIETSDRTLIAALKQFTTIGVSQENSYLKGLDVENLHGGLKWLKVSKKTEQGRLFVNGQMMNYKVVGEDAKTYWQGPEFVTILLRNLPYTPTVDRPPIKPYDLSGYLQLFIESLSTDELLAQIRKSEYIWSLFEDKHTYASDRWGCFVVIERIVQELRWRQAGNFNFELLFPGKRYVASSDDLIDLDRDWLTKAGYVLCPEFFLHLGMPSATSKLGLIQVGKSSKPQFSEYRRNRIAEDYGIQVAYKDLSELSVAEFFAALCKQGAALCSGKTAIFRMQFETELPADLLTRSLATPRNSTQVLLYTIRGVVKYGLEHQIFREIVLSQGEYLTTFSLLEDPIEGITLIARNLPHECEQAGVFLEFEMTKRYMHAFLEVRNTQPEGVADPIPVEEERSPLPSTAEVIGQSEGKVQHPAKKGMAFPESAVAQAATPRAQYESWRASEQFPNRLAETLDTGQSLAVVIAQQTQANIPQLHTQYEEPTEEQHQPEHTDDIVEDFSIVTSPTERQMQQLTLLKQYVSLATGVAIPNTLFLFQGRGSYGINLGETAIGLHEALLTGPFREALETFMHELAHNEKADHGKFWRHTLDTLWGTLWARVNAIVDTIGGGSSEEDHLLRTLPQQWDELRMNERQAEVVLAILASE